VLGVEAVEPATAAGVVASGSWPVGRQLQSALTKEVELVKHGELVAELAKRRTSTAGAGSRTGRSSRAHPRSGRRRGPRQRAGWAKSWLRAVSVGPFGYACAPLYASEHVKQRTQGTEPTGR
jgi:hypothetical protein